MAASVTDGPRSNRLSIETLFNKELADHVRAGLRCAHSFLRLFAPAPGARPQSATLSLGLTPYLWVGESGTRVICFRCPSQVVGWNRCQTKDYAKRYGDLYVLVCAECRTVRLVATRDLELMRQRSRCVCCDAPRTEEPCAGHHTYGTCRACVPFAVPAEQLPDPRAVPSV
jgi:hypothetical protein